MSRLKRYLNRGIVEAGLDEAGRGCLAGPVVAAAVILPKGVRLPGLNDSKKLSASQRELLRWEIERKTIWAVGLLDHQEIDKINILNASFAAMHRAVDQLTKRPDRLLVDGDRFNPYPGIEHDCLIKGDARFAAVAAASVLAKTHRDEIMHKLHARFPMYCWDSNVGYPTRAHRDALVVYGSCEFHRQSFKLLPDQQIELFEVH